MDKSYIKNFLIDKIKVEIELQKKIVEDTKNFKSHGDLKSEGKYDTRAIEAGYLADGQRKRLEELELDLQMLEDIPLDECSSIQIGSVAQLEHLGQSRWYYFAPNCGGMMVQDKEQTFLVISVFSPLGNEAVGLSSGDEFSVETPKEERHYKVIKVL